jgi:flavodoxin
VTKIKVNVTYKNVNIYFFTYTGNSRKIAEIVASRLNTKPREIRTYEFPYPIWLILSFIPYLGVKIDVDKPDESGIILCFPKWTFNCPPITTFLKKFARGKEILMIICYGGFDERRYAEFYRNFALKCGAVKAECLLIKRRKLKENSVEVEKEVEGWLNL